MRIEKLIDYLYDVIVEIKKKEDYEIKADFLEDDVNSYSVDRIPLQRVEERWIFGGKLCQDTYTFRSRFLYTSDQADQLNNIGFWETFEHIIEEKNNKREWPEIDGIEKIECLDSGSLAYAEDNTCEMNIQIKITYREVVE